MMIAFPLSINVKCKVQNSVCTPLDTDCELVTVKLEV